MGGGKKTRVVGDDGHFRAVVARLVKHPIRERHEYIRILLESRIQVPNMVLQLRSGAVDPRGGLPPFLVKMVGLRLTNYDSGRRLSEVLD